MSRAKHISFEELAGNLAELLDEVRAGHTSIVLEYASGGKVLIKPYSTTSRGSRKGTASVTEDGKRPYRQKREIDAKNVSSMGAVYDLDPDSITPG